MSQFDIRSRSREVTCQAKHVILHISRYVWARETHWGHPQRSISVQKTNVASYHPERPVGEVIGSKLHTGHREWPNLRISWDNKHVLTLTFGKRHMMIFLLPCNGEASELTWPQITEIKIHRYTFYTDALTTPESFILILKTVVMAKS